MSLKDLLAYRQTCFIHNLPMQPYFIGKEGDKLNITDNSIDLLVHHRQDLYGKPSLRAISFNFDGTYFWTDVCPDYALAKVFRIYMMCASCNKYPIYKERNVGATTLDNIRSIHHSYVIHMMGDSNKNYDAVLSTEVIKYHTEDKFYHATLDLENQVAGIRMGKCGLGEKVDEVINGIMTLEVPIINMSNIKNIDQLVSKIKLYNLLS